MNKPFSIKDNRGQTMMLSVIFFLFISLTIVLGIVSPVLKQFGNSNKILSSKSSYYLAESGVEDAFYRIKTAKQLSASETLVLGSSTATTTITDLGNNTKQITTLGDTLNFERKIDAIVEAADGASFSYGVQVGTGGFTMSNNSGVNGSVYANGNISGSNGSFITGTAIAANQSTQVVDQQNDPGSPPSNNVTFGTATTTQDSGQSFQVSTSDAITQVSVFVKKTGSPGNLTVRITSDSSGKPATSSLASGTLSASGVTTSYGWVTVVLTTAPTLSTSTTYWLVLDGSVNSSNYYDWGANTTYANGQAKIGQYGTTTWNNTSPSGLDGGFKVYLGGIQSTISGTTVGTGTTGDAWAHNVTGSTVRGSLYCQTGSSNNKSCDTSRADPTPTNFPITDAQISGWKDDALTGGTYSGNYSVSGSSATLGPKKISGNLTITNNGTLTMTGTIWVTGNVDISNNGTLQLTSSYGSGSGLIVVDGTINISNNAVFSGSGTTGSYIMALTTSTSSSAISVGNNAGTVILVAPYGTISFSNNAGAKEATAKTISLSNNATITYESGLANVNFTNGPSGSYAINSWKEIQ